MPVVLLHGYFGFGNAGDEAILAASLRLLRDRAADWRPVVASGDPARTEAMHGVEAIPRSRLLSMLKSLRKDDALLLSGGGLLQDATSLRSLVAYMEPLRRARGRGRAAMWAVGVGPLSVPGKAFVRAVGPIRSVVREEASLAALASLGYPKTSLLLGADAAFTLDAPEPPSAVEPEIGLAIRPHPALDARALARSVLAAAAKGGFSVRLIPFRPTEDGPLCEEIARTSGGQARVAELPADPTRIPEALKDLTGLVAERLHALILGSLAGVPTVAVAYDPKVYLHAGMLGVPVASTGSTLTLSFSDGQAARQQARTLGARARDAFDQLCRDLA